MKLILFILIMLTSPKMSIQTRGDAIVGKWLKIPKKDMIIEVYRVEDEYKGKISWTIDEDSKPSGFLILEDLQYNSKKQVWENGKVYDPVSGGVYSATARLDAGGTLEVLGYKGMKFFGITKYFERVK